MVQNPMLYFLRELEWDETKANADRLTSRSIQIATFPFHVELPNKRVETNIEGSQA